MSILGIITEQMFKDSQNSASSVEDLNAEDFETYACESEENEDKWAEEDQALADFAVAAAVVSLSK